MERSYNYIGNRESVKKRPNEIRSGQVQEQVGKIVLDLINKKKEEKRETLGLETGSYIVPFQER